MIARILVAFIYVVALLGVAPAQFSGSIGTPGVSSPNIVFTATCSQSTTFIARTSGLTVNRKYAYDGLICGLVSDGVWSLLDVLYIYATVDQTTALLNLPNAIYAGVNASALTFTVDRGYTGSGTNNQFIATGFNPNTAVSPQYTQNSAHLSVWNLTNATSDNHMIVSTNTDPTSGIYPKFSDNNTYARINDASPSGGFTATDARGHVLGNRSSSTARQGYRNAVSIGTYGSVASGTVPTFAFGVLGSTTDATTDQCAMASIGSNLNSTQVTAFYNRLRTYMTAVNVP